MITIAKPLRDDVKIQENEHFVRMLPKIRQQARRTFCRCRPERKEDLIQEVIANACSEFVFRGFC
jgi:hypothetical protein